MSEEADKELENAEDSCRNLAEELLREMPDMRDEIEQELNEALTKSCNDNKEGGSSALEAVKEYKEEKSKTQEKNEEISNNGKAKEDAPKMEQTTEENSTHEETGTVEQIIAENSAGSVLNDKNDENPTTVEQTLEEKSANGVFNENNDIADVTGILEINKKLFISKAIVNQEKAENITQRDADDNIEMNKVEHDNNESVEKMETNENDEVEISTTESLEQDNTYTDLKKITNDLNKKNESSQIRKREKEESTDVSRDQTENSTPNAKVAKLELAPSVRKSIIEIHIANNDKVVADEEAAAELERVRKLKEQSIIELNKLKCQEDKLVRLDNISKQLQKNIEQNRGNAHASIAAKNVVATVGEEEENADNKKIATANNIEKKEVINIDDAVTESAVVPTPDTTPTMLNKNYNTEKETNQNVDAEINKHAEHEIEQSDNAQSTTYADIDMIEETAAVAVPDNKSVNREEASESDIETKQNTEEALPNNVQMKSSEDTSFPTVSNQIEENRMGASEIVSESIGVCHSDTINSNIMDESNKNIISIKTNRPNTSIAMITPNVVPTEPTTATALVLTPTKTTTAAITHTDDSSNHSTVGGEHDNHLLPGELTAEEEERDRELRASRATFLQHLPCFKLQRNKTTNSTNTTVGAADPNDNVTNNRNIPRCRECRRRNSHGGADVYCRFYEFRRLQYNEAGDLLVAGFPNPYTDPTPDDIRIWQPDEQSVPTAGWMDIQVARYILLHAGDQFCYLWQQEAEALRLHENPNSVIAWKKIVQGLREICDVCDTTLFNFHWTCDKCGFGVCLDCFKDRKEQRSCHKRRTADKAQRGHDEYHWMLCTATTPTHKNHELRELMLTQIIAGDALNVLGRLLHDIRAMWQVPQMCGCLLSKQQLPVETELGILIQDMIKESQLKQQTSASSLATEETLRKQERMEELHAKKLEFARARGIDYVPGRVWTKQTLGKDPITTAFDNFKHINFLRKGLAGLRRFLPPRAMTLTYSTMLAPGVPHEWLCDGKFLRLTNAMHPDNRILFQEVWKCGQPVMISEVARSLNLDLWRPEAFCNDFGDKPNDLINCLNGNLVPNQPMRYFWEGFQCIKKRLLDSNGKPMLLKLKDWPPGDDFAEILPTRFADLMNGLPMPEYTLRTGNLNIASCLPKMFVPPDLGPKMYNAYGSALHPDKGTTNLHLDISDAVNIMVYVGVPHDADSKPQLVATQRAIALGGCDYLTRARCQSSDVLPGALWHIFPARDADKIRDLLNRVTIERGFRLEPDHDPIHDQNWYLDDKLRARLFKEYGVEGYPIVQCLGDAVFIPAGAPHQVQNLHNCIKVAEDFVSPENITHCYHLTHEFRHLSHSHTNHEDKLQIKNIIYHSIKDCCHILVRALDQRLDEELAKVTEQNAKTEMSLKEATELVNKLTGTGYDDKEYDK